MKNFLLSVLIIFTFSLKAQFKSALTPFAEKKEHLRIVHGDSVVDNYYWMYDYFGKGPDSTKVIDYLKAENAYLDTVMFATKKLQSDLFSEMKKRIKEKDMSVPWFKNGYFYYYRTDEGEQYYKLCRKKDSLNSNEEVILDVDEMARGNDYFYINDFNISEDNNFIAFGVDKISRRQYTIFIKDLKTGQLLKDSITNTEGDPVWASDNKTIFYTAKNEVTLLSEKIKRHTLGNPANEDAVVYDENDKANYIGVWKTKNDKYIFIYSEATLSNELRMIESDKPYTEFKIFQPRIKEVLYNVTPLEDKFLITTNISGAKNFKVMECPLYKTDTANWRGFIPHRTNVLVEDVEEFENFIVINERHEGLSKIRIKNLKGSDDYFLDFNEPAYAVYGGYNPEYNSHIFRFNYTSLVTPYSVIDYNFSTKEKKLMKQMEVLGGYNSSGYITERLMAMSRDGIRIPISVVYKKGLSKDGNAPLLLYGYGSYGYSEDPSFSSNLLSLLDRGFVYAIAHIRGGQEMGRQWYEDGKMMKKKNTFNDFIDCAEYLISEKYTSKEHLYAYGASAGGLLIGAIINMSPHLWHGVIAEVPFVDVVNTMLDENIPLTTNEYDEWGNPNNKENYFYLKSYSPYENIEKKEYPHILVITGLHDSQVQYFEPAKWVAKLREMKTDNNFLLLRTNMEYGHGGASGRFDYLHDEALRYTFLLTLEGINK